jgi:hypothetical protein
VTGIETASSDASIMERIISILPELHDPVGDTALL